MTTKKQNADRSPKAVGRTVPMAAIQRLARQIVDRFQPEQIVLFGSYAYGRPTLDSDVDLLVVMPAANEMRQAHRIRRATDHPFPLDLVVRTPENLKQRLDWGDWFLREIINKGRVLHGKADARVGAQSRRRHQRSAHAVSKQAARE